MPDPNLCTHKSVSLRKVYRKIDGKWLSLAEIRSLAEDKLEYVCEDCLTVIMYYKCQGS